MAVTSFFLEGDKMDRCVAFITLLFQPWSNFKDCKFYDHQFWGVLTGEFRICSVMATLVLVDWKDMRDLLNMWQENGEKCTTRTKSEVVDSW